MRFEETKLPGLTIVRLERRGDERGFFGRTFCAKEFEAHGIPSSFVQCNTSVTHRKGTLRGMHFQKAPYEEGKLVRCTHGVIYDVAVDIRPSSPTFKSWFGLELSAESRDALYLPPGFAHGFQTLVDGCEVLYQMSASYEPTAGSGVRWNDSAFSIQWPLANPSMSERDATYPDFIL